MDETIEELCGGSGRCSKAGNADSFVLFSILMLSGWFAGYACLVYFICTCILLCP